MGKCFLGSGSVFMAHTGPVFLPQNLLSTHWPPNPHLFLLCHSWLDEPTLKALAEMMMDTVPCTW